MGPKPPSQVIGNSAGISISCRISVSGRNSTSGSTFILHARVTWLPRWRTVLHQDGSQRASDQFPGALGRNPTRGQFAATYVTAGIAFHVNYRQFHQMITYWLGENRRDYRSKEVTIRNYGKLNYAQIRRFLRLKRGKITKSGNLTKHGTEMISKLSQS